MRNRKNIFLYFESVWGARENGVKQLTIRIITRFKNKTIYTDRLYVVSLLKLFFFFFFKKIKNFTV